MIAGIATLVVAVPWLWRNWQLYGDPFGWSIVLATIDRRQGPLSLSDMGQLLKGWWLSFWGKFGGAGHIPLPTIFYVIWAVLGVLVVAGWILWLIAAPAAGQPAARDLARKLDRAARRAH